MGNGIIKGNTNEEKFASADKALSQLERKLRSRRVLAPLNPTIIMGYCKEDDEGVIARGMFPVSGIVTKVSIYIDELENPEFLKSDSLKFYIESRHANGTSATKELSSKRLSVGTFTNFKVEADSRFTILVNTKVLGVWYGLTLEPEMSMNVKIDVSSGVDDLSPVEREFIEE